MGSERYRNCFYYFRGPAPRLKEAERLELRERQFEDNTTKALVNVLEHGGMLESFLRQVVGLDPQAEDDASFFLQEGPKSGIPEQKVLLGISALGEMDPKLWAAQEQPSAGRIDAACLLPNEALLLIETKVTEYLDPLQLNRHAKDWGLSLAGFDATALPGDWRLVTWASIHRWTRDEAPRQAPGSVARFLLQQLREYLELTGLAPFAGFRQEHFDYFKQTKEQRLAGEQGEIAEQIKARLDGIWGVVKELAPDTFDRLGEIRVGWLKAQYDSAWAETHSGSGKPNLTVEIGAHDLQVNLVGWTGDQVALFERWLQSRAAPSQLGSLPDHELVFFKRIAHADHKGAPFWMGARYEVIERVNAPSLAHDLGPKVAAVKASLDPTWERIAYHLRRSWLPTEVVGVGEGFVPEVVHAIERLLPVLEEIRGGGTG